MTRISKEQALLQLLIELSDEKGHSNRELTEKSKFYKTRISNLFRDLESDGIIYHSIRETTNPKIKRKDSRYEEKPYFIGPKSPTVPQERLEVFKSIFQKIVSKCESDLQEKFFRSEYINTLIKEVGFIPIYNIIKTNLHNELFRKSASRAFLNQSSVVDEYRNQLKIIGNNDYLIHGLELVPYLANNNIIQNDLIGILPDFDILTAIEFYRKIIGDGYSKLYRDIAPEYFISDAMKEFTDYDVYLSPFSSYPKNNPANLLYEIPYERIYNDAYILNKADLKKFIKRAYVVYSHFAEMLLIGCIEDMRHNEIEYINYKFLQYENYRENMDDDFDFPLDNDESRISRVNYLDNIGDYIETTIKLAIYHWNIGSHRFDQLIASLGHEVRGKYHIRSNNKGIQIIDLEGGEPSMVVFGNISLLPGPVDPFESLWSCRAFKELDLESEKITYDDILGYIKSNLNPRYDRTNEG